MVNIEQTKWELTPCKWLCKENKYMFRVPVYQRLFAWDTPQFDRLLSDLQEWNEKNKGEFNKEPYYLGIITVVKQDDSFILIDGQQRLTVIAILMGMFKGNIDSIAKHLDYEARPNDRKALEKIWKNGTKWLGKTKDELNIEMDKNQIVSDSMRSFIRHILENQSKWDDIIEEIFNRLTLLVSCLPDNYEECLELQNEYFEKMNSAGKQLEPYEILKVRICKNQEKEEFNKWNSVEDFTKQFKCQCEETHLEEYSILGVLEGKRIDEKTIHILGNTIHYSDENRRTSLEKWRPSLITFPMFLLHTLNIKDIGFQIPNDSHSLLKCFEGRNTSDFVSLMSQYREFLDKWIIHKNIDVVRVAEEGDLSNDISDFSYWNNENQVKTIDASPDEKETCRNLKQIQMALYALGDSKQEWMVFAYREYNKSQEAFKDNPLKQAEFLLVYLVRYLIRKAEFEKEILLNEEWPDEYLTYNHNTHAQFVCLDYFLWLLANSNFSKDLQEEVFGKNIPGAVKNFVPKPNKSVEHFHPQTDTNSNNETVALWNGHKDMFGNLALISAGRNSEYGNYSVDEKTARINSLVNRNEIESIKLYLMKEACNGNDSQWTPCRAHCHANKMLKVLKWGLDYYGMSQPVKN